MQLAQEKIEKLNQLLIKSYSTFEQKDLDASIEYVLSDHFKTEQDIIDSIPYMNALLSNQIVKNMLLITKDWVRWARLIRPYISDSQQESSRIIRNERGRIISELKLSKLIFDNFSTILQNLVSRDIKNIFININNSVHKEDGITYINFEIDGNKLMAAILVGEAESQIQIMKDLTDLSRKILNIGSEESTVDVDVNFVY